MECKSVTTCTVGVFKKFPYHLRSVCVLFCMRFAWGLCWPTVRFALGLRRVCVGLPCPFTVCLIIRNRNSGIIRVRVQGTYSARCC